MSNPVRSALLGVAVADALGVPVEFTPRAYFQKNPVTDMTGYGTYNQPPGTWSDDSSLTFCLAESLCEGYQLADMAKRFVQWKNEALWTPYNHVFDIGITTSQSLTLLKGLLRENDTTALLKLRNEADEKTNGNGSLMRILPLAFFLENKTFDEQFEYTWQVSALTHPHIRAALACFMYLRMALFLMQGIAIADAYTRAQHDMEDLFERKGIVEREKQAFNMLINNNIGEMPSSVIESSGYVMHSLEASIWCLLNHNSYSETVLAAVNLGHDTDTTAAIAGGLAGLAYGENDIPQAWISQLARKDDILALADSLYTKYLAGWEA